VHLRLTLNVMEFKARWRGCVRFRGGEQCSRIGRTPSLATAAFGDKRVLGRYSAVMAGRVSY